MRTERRQISKPEQRLAAGMSRSLPMDLGWDTARLGKPCPGRRPNKESPEDVRSLLSGVLCASVLEHSQNSVLKHTSSPWSSLSSGRQDPGIISQALLGLALAPVQLSTHSKTHPVYPTAVQLFICIPSLDYSIISVSQNITPPSKPGYDDIFPTKLLQLAQASTNLFEFEQQIICAFSIIPVLPYFVF